MISSGVIIDVPFYFLMTSQSVELTDSEMEKLDDVLGAAFRSMQRGGKRDVKAKARQLRNYKMKCLELLEIIVQNESTDVTFLVVRHESLYALFDNCSPSRPPPLSPREH